jgi:hypothetical protein
MNATARVELALYCKQIDAPIEPIEPTIELLNCNTNPQAQECNNYSKTYSQIQDCKEAILYVSVVYPNGSSYNINSSGANGNTSTSPQQCTVFNFSAASYPGTFSIQTNQPC